MTEAAHSPDTTRRQGAMLALREIECLATEMSALMRMGMPLGKGLRELAPSLRGNLPSLMRKLAGELESGKDLSAALHQERERLPIFFRAVVDAGIRGGEPAIALKSIAEMARRLDDHRRVEFHALLYPLMVGMVATGLIGLFLTRILPNHMQMYATNPTGLPRYLSWISSVGEAFANYWWIPLASLIVAWLLVWLRPVSWSLKSPGANWLGVGVIPLQRNIVAASRWSTMLEVLVLLLKRKTPLHESLSLAASIAIPERRLPKINQLSERLRAGGTLYETDYVAAGLPRAIASAIATPRRAEGLIQVLAQLETEYRWLANDLRRRFNGPWIGTIAVALSGLMVLAYIALVVLPITQVFYDLVNNQIR